MGKVVESIDYDISEEDRIKLNILFFQFENTYSKRKTTSKTPKQRIFTSTESGKALRYVCNL